jgi:D-aminopeptidase
MAAVPRVADLGIRIGALSAGPTASILDVPGVGLGHATVWRDEPDPPLGRGVARTGVTVLLPGDDTFRRPVVAGGSVLNGAGECTGLLTAREWGIIETPIFLTSTLQVGRVYDAACELLLEREPEIAEDVVIPVVAECDDSWLSDCRRMQVTRSDVASAWAAAQGSIGSLLPPDEGSVGAGTGMTCLGFKGGIGTSSRVVPSRHTVGVLLLCNFGDGTGRLTVDGVPVGRLLPSAEPTAPPAGSCIGVVVTDAPLLADECERLSRRIGLGLARAGSTAHHGSGEIFLGLSNGLRTDRAGRLVGPEPLRGRAVDALFEATVDAAEEAVLNALLTSPTVVGRGGHVAHGLPAEDVRALLAEHGRGG